jgi:enhancing lycopene biosynthesis protein 2
MSKVAIVLAGCGVYDGSEIHESVLCLLALAQAGHTYKIFAPDIPQRNVVNHLNQHEMAEESRNVLVEAARIARGDIAPLAELNPKEFDSILIPGGFGVGLNLSSFAIDAEECEVNPDLQRILLEFHKLGRPIGATCITPAVIAKVFQGVTSVKLTLGESDANRHLTHLGHQAVSADSRTVVSDDGNRIYTTPCYMNLPDLPGMYEAVRKLVEKL